MRGPQPFMTYGSFQSDKTVDAINEMRKEFAAVRSDRPIVGEELDQLKRSEVLRLPASQETWIP
jgi:predicted Zn-dependent peptidase